VKIRRFIPVVVAFGLVTVATAVGAISDADITVGALILLVAVLLAALQGPIAGAIAAVAGFLSLNWFFTPPKHSLEINSGDDVVAAAVFVIAAALIGWVVTRLGVLRRHAEQRAREAQIRLDLTNRLAGGEDPSSVARSAAEAIVGLFGFTVCTVSLGGVSELARGPGDQATGDHVRLEVGQVVVDGLGPITRMEGDDHSVLEALVAALAAAQDRVRLERESREARVAIQVGQSRAGLLSAVSHNLRTPLASIRAAASTLRSPEAHLEAEDRRDLLDTVVDETERLERMVAKTLDLSRIRAGGLDPELRTIDLGDLAAAAVRRLRPLARAHVIRLMIDPELPAVSVDVGMIEEVFLDLLENALRFAPPGSEILVSATPVDREVEVRVADHGPGVPEADRLRVFEEFVRVDARPDSSGTGLGLAIVRALVAAHSGRAWVEDTADGGATFVFRLPVGRAT
jgi:two-component system sensor histidine kinase KdpD